MRGNDFPRHLIVWFAGSERAANIVVERYHAVLKANDLRVPGIVLEEIAEVYSPLVHPLRASKQTLDIFRPLVRRCIRDKRGDLRGGRDAAGQIQRDAPDELKIIG